EADASCFFVIVITKNIPCNTCVQKIQNKKKYLLNLKSNFYSFKNFSEHFYFNNVKKYCEASKD
ncbi:MAG: hypothetical protein AABZ74_15210, partial [Cyanobacteriota bacterium]